MRWDAASAQTPQATTPGTDQSATTNTIYGGEAKTQSYLNATPPAEGEAVLVARPAVAEAAKNGQMGHGVWFFNIAGTFLEAEGGPKADKGSITGNLLAADVKLADQKQPYASVVDPTNNPTGRMQILGRMQLPSSLQSIEAINGIVNGFKPNSTPTAYHWGGPNSNTFAHWFGNQIGFNFSSMSSSRYKLIGWDNQLGAIQ